MIAEKSDNRLLWIDVVKGLAILGVILQHTLQRTIYYFDQADNFILTISNHFVASVNMQWFFAVSGIVYFLKREQYLANPLYFFKTRFYDLIIPYLIFGPLVWLGKFVLSAYVRYEVSVDDLLQMFVTPIAFMWFIYVLFFIEIIVYLVDKYIRGQYGIILLCYFAVYVALVLTTGRGKDVFHLTSYYLFWYYLGGFFVYYKEKLSDRKLIYINGICWIILFSIYTIWKILSVNILFSKLLIIGYTMCSVLFVLLICQQYARFGRLSLALNYFGRKSMYLYILNPIIINGTREILIKCGINNMYVNMIAFFLSAIVIACLIAKIAKHVSYVEFPFSPRKYLLKKTHQHD